MILNKLNKNLIKNLLKQKTLPMLCVYDIQKDEICVFVLTFHNEETKYKAIQMAAKEAAEKGLEIDALLFVSPANMWTLDEKGNKTKKREVMIAVVMETHKMETINYVYDFETDLLVDTKEGESYILQYFLKEYSIFKMKKND